jgi:hypothetical protein
MRLLLALCVAGLALVAGRAEAQEAPQLPAAAPPSCLSGAAPDTQCVQQAIRAYCTQNYGQSAPSRYRGKPARVCLYQIREALELALGAAQVSLPPDLKLTKAMITIVNAREEVLGGKVTIVFFTIGRSQTTSIAQTVQLVLKRPTTPSASVLASRPPIDLPTAVLQGVRGISDAVVNTAIQASMASDPALRPTGLKVGLAFAIATSSNGGVEIKPVSGLELASGAGLNATQGLSIEVLYGDAE